MVAHNYDTNGIAEGMGYVITNYVDSSVKIQDDDAREVYGWLRNYLHEAMAGLDNKHDFESVYKVFNSFIEKYYFNNLTPLNKYFHPFAQKALSDVDRTASAGTLQRVVDFESYAGNPSPTNEMAIILEQEIYYFKSPKIMPTFNLTDATQATLKAYTDALPPGRDCIVYITGTKADFRDLQLLKYVREVLGITNDGAFLSPDASQLPIESFGPLFGPFPPVSIVNIYQPKCFLSERFDPATMTKTELQVEANVNLEIFYCILKTGGDRIKLFIEIFIPQGQTAYNGGHIRFFTRNGTGANDTTVGDWIPLKNLPKAPTIAEVSIWLFGMKGAKLKSVGAKLKNLFQTGNLKQNTRAKDIKDKYFARIIASMPDVIQNLFTTHFQNYESLGTGSKRLGDLTYLLDAIMAQAIAAGQVPSYKLSPHGAYAIGGDKFAWLYNVHTKMTNSIFISKSDKILTMKVYLKPLDDLAREAYQAAHDAYEAGIDTELLTKIQDLFAALGITTLPTFSTTDFSTTDLSGGKSLIIDAFNAKILQWTNLLLTYIAIKTNFFNIKTAVDATARNPATFTDAPPGATYTSDALSNQYYGSCSKVIHKFGVIDSLCKSKKKIENWTAAVTTPDEKKRWDGIFFEATNVVTDADTLVIDPDFGNYDDDYKTLGYNMFSISKVIDDLNKQIFNLNKQFQLTSPKILNIFPIKKSFKSSKDVIVKWFEIADNAARAIQCIRVADAAAADGREVVGGGKAIVDGPSQKRGKIKGGGLWRWQRGDGVVAAKAKTGVSGVRGKDTGPNRILLNKSIFALDLKEQRAEIQKTKDDETKRLKELITVLQTSSDYNGLKAPPFDKYIRTFIDQLVLSIQIHEPAILTISPDVHEFMKVKIIEALYRLYNGNTQNSFTCRDNDIHELCLYVQYIYENARELDNTLQTPVDDNYYYYILFIMFILRPNYFNGQLLMINRQGFYLNPDIELNPLLETTFYKIGGVSRRINKNKKSRKNKNNNKKSRKKKNKNKKSKKNKTIKKRKLF